VGAETSLRPLSTLEIVDSETLAWPAMSARVTRFTGLVRVSVMLRSSK
jgi:hypothetical protein